MKRQRKVISLCLMLLLCAMPTMAATGDDGSMSTGGASSNGGGTGVGRLAKKLLALIDTMAVSGIDRAYIGVPRRPWQVLVRGNINYATLTMSSTIDAGNKFIDLAGSYESKPTVRSGADTFVGLWAGYRGYGIGYSHQVTGGGNGSLFTIGATGGSYGVNLRRHAFESDVFEVYNHGLHTDGTVIDETKESTVYDPISVKSLIIDGYYMFNGRRYSYAAAYDHSAYQLRSAGSVMAGAMYYYSNVNYATPMNSDMMLLMDNVGQIRQWQLSLGAGYAYNYVPARGFLISAMFMPMLTVYNRLRLYRFDTKYRQMAESAEVFGEQDMEKLLLSTALDENYMQMRPDPINPEETKTSHLMVNFNARASLTYNIGERAYINAYGQLYNFRFSQDRNHGALTEWYINASLGLRF